MSDPQQRSTVSPPRVFVPDDAEVRAAVAAAGHPELVPTPVARLDAGADVPGADDVVLLPTATLPTGTLELAARLGSYAPAGVVLLLSPTGVDPDVLSRALRLGACDVVDPPVRPSELRLRLELARRRPRTTVEAAGDVPALTHQLTNVLAALRLTAYAVGRLPRPAVAHDGTDTRSLLDGRVLASRIETEVDQAVLLVAELDQRVHSPAVPPGPEDGIRRWA